MCVCVTLLHDAMCLTYPGRANDAESRCEFVSMKHFRLYSCSMKALSSSEAYALTTCISGLK